MNPRCRNVLGALLATLWLVASGVLILARLSERAPLAGYGQIVGITFILVLILCLWRTPPAAADLPELVPIAGPRLGFGVTLLMILGAPLPGFVALCAAAAAEQQAAGRSGRRVRPRCRRRSRSGASSRRHGVQSGRTADARRRPAIRRADGPAVREIWLRARARWDTISWSISCGSPSLFSRDDQGGRKASTPAGKRERSIPRRPVREHRPSPACCTAERLPARALALEEMAARCVV